MSHDEPVSILVIEDEALIRFAIAEELSDHGYRVFEAANAEQAIALLESEPSIRVMFTDVDMPGSMDGLQLSAAVRNRWPPVKIVVTSGKRLVEITDLPDGGVFFSKPYAHDQVISSFRTLLSES